MSRRKGQAKYDTLEEVRLAERRERVAKLYLENKPIYEISKIVGVSTVTVGKDLAVIREEWLESRVENFDAVKSKELAKLDLLERVAWETWFKSQEDSVTRTVEKEYYPRFEKDPKTGKPIGNATLSISGAKKKEQRKGQIGELKCFDIIKWCIEFRAKLLGFVKEEKPQIINVLHWGQLDGSDGKEEVVVDEDPLVTKMKELGLGSNGEKVVETEPGSSEDGTATAPIT